jgi:protein-serine/threonine kinase
MSDSAKPSAPDNRNNAPPPPPESSQHWAAENTVTNVQSALKTGSTPAHASLEGASASVFNPTTISPFAPPTLFVPNSDYPNSLALDTAHRLGSPNTPRATSSPLSAHLRIQTDIPGYTVTAASAVTPVPNPVELHPAPNTIPIPRTPSVKKILAGGFGSSTNLGSAPNSVVSSPMLNAISDVTPLPSPLMLGDSPGPWRKLTSRPASIEEVIPIMHDSALVTAAGESISSAIANQSKRRAYHGLGISDAGVAGTVINREKQAEGHTRNRSLSDYVPECIQGLKPRNIAASGTHSHIMLDPTPETSTPVDTPMRREPHLALQRGLAPIPRSVLQQILYLWMY